jgi:hypothetical protein
MAGKGRKVMFHGMFTSKEKARRKEASVGNGAYIEEVKVRGKARYAVITRREGK